MSSPSHPDKPQNNDSIVKPYHLSTETKGETWLDSYLDEQTQKQANYIIYLGAGMGKKEAARKAGFQPRVRVRPSQAIETPQLRAHMQAALRRQGATFDKAARVLAQAMDATAYAVDKGEVIPSDVPDHKTRVQAARVSGDFMGLTERSSASGAVNNVVINLPAGFGERYGKIVQGE